MSPSISEPAITSRFKIGTARHPYGSNYKRPKATLVTFRVSCYKAGTVGERIRKKRLVMGLKQVELALLLGVHEMTIGNWETEKTTPSGQRLDLVKRFLRGQLLQGRPADRKQSRAS